MEHPAWEPLSSVEPERPGGGSGDLRDSARWWEPRRILYNIVLAAVFVALAERTWSRFRPELTWGAMAPLTALALLANLCYTVAYAVDAPVRLVRDPRIRLRWRWSLWLAGTLLSVLFETYWFLDEILPPIR